MSKQKRLVERITDIVGYDETIARNVLREIADWMDDDYCLFYTAYFFRKEADRYD